jgi:hypothetical protein
MGNLLRFGHFVKDENCKTAEHAAAAELATLLLFQQHRFVPPKLTRRKSLPAAYLDPILWGSLMGLSQNRDGQQQNLDANLKALGVKSNHLNGEWTGVSLARWKDLIELMKKNHLEDDDLLVGLLCLRVYYAKLPGRNRTFWTFGWRSKGGQVCQS